MPETGLIPVCLCFHQLSTIQIKKRYVLKEDVLVCSIVRLYPYSMRFSERFATGRLRLQLVRPSAAHCCFRVSAPLLSFLPVAHPRVAVASLTLLEFAFWRAIWKRGRKEQSGANARAKSETNTGSCAACTLMRSQIILCPVSMPPRKATPAAKPAAAKPTAAASKKPTPAAKKQATAAAAAAEEESESDDEDEQYEQGSGSDEDEEEDGEEGEDDEQEDGEDDDEEGEEGDEDEEGEEGSAIPAMGPGDLVKLLAMISSMKQQSGPIITAVLLATSGKASEVTLDMTPKLDAVASLLGGKATFVGQYPAPLSAVIMTLREGEKASINKHTLPAPYDRDAGTLRGPLVLIRMDDASNPESLSLAEYEAFKADPAAALAAAEAAAASSLARGAGAGAVGKAGSKKKGMSTEQAAALARTKRKSMGIPEMEEEEEEAQDEEEAMDERKEEETKQPKKGKRQQREEAPAKKQKTKQQTPAPAAAASAGKKRK